MKKFFSAGLISFLALSGVFHTTTSIALASDDLATKLSGQILLQVESHGEAWYIDPQSLRRFYLKDGETAYQALRKFGLGITTADLNKIPVGVEKRFQDTDTDGDGLADSLEEGLGTNPLQADSDNDGSTDAKEILETHTNPNGSGVLLLDEKLSNSLKGRILLQVESHGEAWYINPKDGKRYYMKNGEAAYQVMRYLSLGISNNDLLRIVESGDSGVEVAPISKPQYYVRNVGDEVTFSTIKFKINSVVEQWYLSGPEGKVYSTDTNEQFIILNAEVTNITGDNINFDPNQLVLVEAIGTSKTHLVFPDASKYLSDNLSEQVLAPGAKKIGKLVFKAPSLDQMWYLLPMDKSGTNETYEFVINKSARLCSEWVSWTKEECAKVASNEIWLGMSELMLRVERGAPDVENLSNYGNGDQWQWCWLDQTPACLYDRNDDGLVDAYN